MGEVGREDAETEDAAAGCDANVIVTSYNVLRTDAGVLGGQVRETPAESVHRDSTTWDCMHERKNIQKTGRHVMRSVQAKCCISMFV